MLHGIEFFIEKITDVRVIAVLISQYIQIWNHHVICPKLMLYVSYTTIKIIKNKKKIFTQNLGMNV